MPKILSGFLALALCLAISGIPASAENGAIMPCHTNATVADVTLVINPTGLATVKSTCTGILGTTWIRAQTYLEKKVNGVWSRVDILSSNDEWVTAINTRLFSVTKTHQLTSRGSYRAVTIFTVTAATSETITVISYATY